MNYRHVIVFLSAITIAVLVSVSCRQQPQVDLDWIDIAGGSFEMGNPNDKSDDSYEQNYLNTEVPVHEVTVPDFKMLKSEVTVEQYKACVDAEVCTEPVIGDFATWNTEGMEEHPVNYVSWHQAVEFCDWVNGRLPTEAEWEYAARNKGADLYPWGDAAATCEYAVMKEDEIGCGTGETWPVCSKSATAAFVSHHSNVCGAGLRCIDTVPRGLLRQFYRYRDRTRLTCAGSGQDGPYSQ